MTGKRHLKGPRTPRPRLRTVAFRDAGGVSFVVFEVPAGATTRADVVTRGAARYVNVAGRWKLWPGTAEPPWARSWGRPKQLGMVPGADPDPEREPEPGAFTVDVAVWSSWPEDARAALRAAAPWSKAPGVMRTDPLDGPTAERVRSVAAQRQLVGLEEVTGEVGT